MWRGQNIGDSFVVGISRKVLKEESKIFDFDNICDVSVGAKIEIDGKEYKITDKKYQLNGVVDYYIEDKFIECENFKEIYERVKKEAKEFLSDQRELEDQKVEPEKDKKTFWWYLGIR